MKKPGFIHSAVRCSGCQRDLPLNAYSNAQREKDVRGEACRCTRCIEGSPPAEGTAAPEQALLAALFANPQNGSEAAAGFSRQTAAACAAKVEAISRQETGADGCVEWMSNFSSAETPCPCGSGQTHGTCTVCTPPLDEELLGLIVKLGGGKGNPRLIDRALSIARRTEPEDSLICCFFVDMLASAHEPGTEPRFQGFFRSVELYERRHTRDMFTFTPTEWSLHTCLAQCGGIASVIFGSATSEPRNDHLASLSLLLESERRTPWLSEHCARPHARPSLAEPISVRAMD